MNREKVVGDHEFLKPGELYGQHTIYSTVLKGDKCKESEYIELKTVMGIT